jgi:mono/diheme cytochrome c family protein
MAARGEALYQQHQCRNCHELGESPKLLGGLSERLGYNAVIDVLEAPQSPMPVFPLSDTQRRELAVFLLAPQPGDTGADN